MTTGDVPCLVDKMRGQEYIDTLRRIHAEARERGGFVRCSGEELHQTRYVDRDANLRRARRSRV